MYMSGRPWTPRQLLAPGPRTLTALTRSGSYLKGGELPTEIQATLGRI